MHAGHELLLRRLHAEALRLSHALRRARSRIPRRAGALGIFNHPGSGEFDNFAFNANADNAMQGIAVRSGLAFAPATDCANANVGSTDYSPRWKEALNKGFHLGPVADHDSHCNNYGMGMPTRTVYLGAPSLTKAALLQAHKARHFFATEDPNAQLVFRTERRRARHGRHLQRRRRRDARAAVYDPDGEAVSTLEIWRGQIGGGVPAAAYATLLESVARHAHRVADLRHLLLLRPRRAGRRPRPLVGADVDHLRPGRRRQHSTSRGWRVTQVNATFNYTIPAGTAIPANGYLVIGRNATKAAFEAFWGAALPANVVYLNSADAMPVINGSETYNLYNAAAPRWTARRSPCRRAAAAPCSARTPAMAATERELDHHRLLDRHARQRRRRGLRQGRGDQRVFRRPRHRQLRLRVRRAAQRQVGSFTALLPGTSLAKTVLGVPGTLSLKSKLTRLAGTA